MLRRLTVLLLTAGMVACAPIPPPTPPPATASAVATVTVEATAAPPYKLVHPARVAVAVANVVELWCYSNTTTIALFDHAVEWHRDDAAYRECVAKGELS